MSKNENEQTEDCRECKLKLRDSERALQCDFCDNMYCYKCTRVWAKSYDAICRSSQEEGIQWFCFHCRISFHGVTKITKKVNKIEQTQKEILASVEELMDKVSGETTGASRKEIEMMVREEFEESQHRDERKLNIMCFGLEESSSLNIELKKKEDETTVTSIFQEVMGEEEDFSACKMVRIGRPVQPVESQDNGVITLLLTF